MKRNLLALALATAMLAPQPLSAAPVLQTTVTMAGPIQTCKLPNGLEVILKENHAAPVVTWMVYYKVGSRNEAGGWTGSTHLLEHMMFKGTKHLGKGQIAQLLERNGANYNATTATDRTSYFETYASDKLELGIRLEADRMRNSLILDSERQSEMTVVRNEMERDETEPEWALYDELTSHAYKSHPYHHPTIGWRSDVEGVPTSRLHAFYDTYYHPNNAVAILVGDFKTPEAMRLIEKYFGPLPAYKAIPPMYTTEEPQEGVIRFQLHRRGETNAFQAGWHIPDARNQDIAPLMVLDDILSGGKTARLYKALVDTQLATSAWSECGLQRDPSLFRIGLSLQQGIKHADAEKVVQDVLKQIKTEPLSTVELAKAKNQAEASYIYKNEGTSGLASNLGEFAAMTDRWQRAFELLDQIKRVSAADVQRVAKQYLQDDNMTVGLYVASPDGPVWARPKNAGHGKAVASKGDVKPLPLLDFERQALKPHQLVRPIRRVLSNGMTVLVLENANNPTVAIDGFVRTGGLQDPKGEDGLASMAASLLDEGTATRDKFALAEALESMASSLSFSGDTESTGLKGHCLSKNLDRTLDLMADELMHPSFPQAELDKARSSWITAIKQAEDQPGTRVARAFNHAIYPVGHPYYELDPQDQIKALQSLTVADLQRFHAQHYGPNALVLTIAGKVKADQVVAGLERRFAAWPKVATAPVTIPAVHPSKPSQVVIPMPDKPDVEIRLGNPGGIKRTDKDFYAASLANYVLGGSPLSARLGVKLRDKMGLTYNVDSEFSATRGAGAWYAEITVNEANVPTALRALKGEIQHFLAGGVTTTELASAKSCFIGSQAVALATNEGMASSLARIELYGLGLDFWSRYPQLIQQVTLGQVNQAAHKLIRPEAAELAIAGPYHAP